MHCQLKWAMLCLENVCCSKKVNIKEQVERKKEIYAKPLIHIYRYFQHEHIAHSSWQAVGKAVRPFLPSDYDCTSAIHAQTIWNLKILLCIFSVFAATNLRRTKVIILCYSCIILKNIEGQIKS